MALLTAIVVVWSLFSFGSVLSLASPWLHHPIDYSAVNEYVREHYGGSESYFDGNQVQTAIWDARLGVLVSDDDNTRKPAVLEEDGFCLRELSHPPLDWSNPEQVKKSYLSRLVELMEKEFSRETLLSVVFWHPMLRTSAEHPLENDDNNDGTISRSNVASLVHIDNDVGAFELDELLKVVFNNRMDDDDDDKNGNDDMATVMQLVESGHRFAIVNAWKNIRVEPVQRAPLALFRPTYAEPNGCVPTARPDDKRSRWYTFPRMTRDEVLLFKQYDRRADKRSDIWHCALTHVGSDDAVLRESLDVRAFCVFDTVVPTGLDRYGENRIRPNLSLQESECFCTEQAHQRNNAS